MADPETVEDEFENKRLLFPKALPERTPGALVDDYGFNQTEKVALRQAFELIKPFHRRFGKDIFYTYLTKHELTIELFRPNGDETEQISLSALHGHALAMMNMLHMVVCEGLHDFSLYNSLYQDNRVIHKKSKVPSFIVKRLGRAIKEYILHELRHQSSPSLVSGFNKILKHFLGSPEMRVDKSYNSLNSQSSLNRMTSLMIFATAI